MAYLTRMVPMSILLPNLQNLPGKNARYMHTPYRKRNLTSSTTNTHFANPFHTDGACSMSYSLVRPKQRPNVIARLPSSIGMRVIIRI